LSRNQLLEQVRRIEEIELELTVFNAGRALARVDKELKLKKIGDCSLLYEVNSPESVYYNRVKGFGIRDLDKLEQILNTYKALDITPCFDMTPDRINEEVSLVLSDLGYAVAEQLVFMQLDDWEEERINDGMGIVEVTSENAEEFVNIILLSRGDKEFDQSVIDRKKGYFHTPCFRNYIAYVEGEAAGIASLFISGKEGYIANDFTFERFRGKGIQKALLKHRINAARKQGLERLYTDVEFGSVSHNNMEKLGFRNVFINSFWMKLR